MLLTTTSMVFATFLWWFSTGVIFYLNARPEWTFRWSMLCGSILAVAALLGLWFSAREASAAAAFLAFSCGLVIWGWHAMSYYMGIITGPCRQPCPPESKGLERFRHAAATSLHHEFAILATVGLFVGMVWGQPNQFGLWTFLLLWGMHISAKLNVFLGVRNLNAEFLPKRLGYLSSYFRHAPMNLLFPLSVTVGTMLTVFMALEGMRAAPGTLEAIGYTLLATLCALAVVEHWFMVLPIRAEALWQWSLRSSASKAADADSGHTHNYCPGRSAIPAKPGKHSTSDGSAKA